MSRAVFQPTAFSRDTTFEYGIENQSVPEVYSEVFGVRGGFWQGWYGAAVSRRENKIRNEDFIGAVPVEGLSPAEFPELAVDTFLLRTKLRWSDPIECGSGIFKKYPYMDSIGALPEVGFTIPNRLAGTESLYLYRSRFGEAKYPFFDLDFNDYQGTVVAVRRDAGFFRNSHWVFTPMVLGPAEFQKSFNTMLDWLFAEPWGGPSMGVSARRTPASEELDYTSEALRLAQYGEQRRVEKLHEIMGGQRWIKNQFEFDAKYRQWKAEKRALEMAEEATF
jgi:hypothetical protein